MILGSINNVSCSGNLQNANNGNKSGHVSFNKVFNGDVEHTAEFFERRCGAKKLNSERIREIQRRWLERRDRSEPLGNVMRELLGEIMLAANCKKLFVVLRGVGSIAIEKPKNFTGVEEIKVVHREGKKDGFLTDEGIMNFALTGLGLGGWRGDEAHHGELSISTADNSQEHEYEEANCGGRGGRNENSHELHQKSDPRQTTPKSIIGASTNEWLWNFASTGLDLDLAERRRGEAHHGELSILMAEDSQEHEYEEASCGGNENSHELHQKSDPRQTTPKSLTGASTDEGVVDFALRFPERRGGSEAHHGGSMTPVAEDPEDNEYAELDYGMRGGKNENSLGSHHKLDPRQTTPKSIVASSAVHLGGQFNSARSMWQGNSMYAIPKLIVASSAVHSGDPLNSTGSMRKKNAMYATVQRKRHLRGA